MASLSDRPPKNNKTLYLGIAAIVVIAIVVAAAAIYLYMDGQDRQNKQRENLKQTFSDQFNTTNQTYASISGYRAAPNKNDIEEFRAWIDGYRQLTDNYTLAVATLSADGAEYKSVIGSSDTDYANVTAACNKANDTVRSLSNTVKSYETEYQGRVWLRDNASRDYSLALERSGKFYSDAWNLLQEGSSYEAMSLRFDGYKKYLTECQMNITYYNDSLSLVKTTGETYRAYLEGNSYYSIDTTFNSMLDNVTKLQKRHAELQNNKPNVTVDLVDEAHTIATEDGVTFRTAYHFQLQNRDWPKKAWNFKIQFQLIDKDTSSVRDEVTLTSEKGDIPEMTMYITNFYTVNLKCDLNKQYNIRYTISYDY